VVSSAAQVAQSPSSAAIDLRLGRTALQRRQRWGAGKT
jgi:hypothetical protein